jgi:hypothetical protein
MNNDRAAIVVRTWIMPIIASAFATYPELDVDEVLARCRVALEMRLREEFENIVQQQAREHNDAQTPA